MKCKYCVCFKSNDINEYGKCRDIKKEVKGEAVACKQFKAKCS